MSIPNIHCTVLTSDEGSSGRPYPRYSKVSPWSDPWIAKLLVAKIGDSGVGIVTAKETRPAKSTAGSVRFSEPQCELPPPLDDAWLDTWRISPRDLDETDEDIFGVTSPGKESSIDDLFEDETE